MQQVAEADQFRQIFPGVPSIGGRYSALSNFGVVPGRAMGLDVEPLPGPHAGNGRGLRSRRCGRTESRECCSESFSGPPRATDATNSRSSPRPGSPTLGAWLEQLMAESTGKKGKGIVPVDREDVGPPEIYGNDRVFAYVRLESAPDKAQDAKVAALEQAGHPVVRIRARRHLRSGPGILPLGNRHGGGRLDHRNQRLQSARCGSQQDRDSQTDRRIREDRFPARGEACSRRWRHQVIHRRGKCRCPGQSRGQR